MNLVALMPARNEDWCIGLTARAALMWCDKLVVLAHCCTDQTSPILYDIADEYPGRVAIIQERDPVWHEMAHRQHLLDAARFEGATHIALVDADEILTGNGLAAIRAEVDATPANRTMELPWLSLRGDIEHVYSSGWWARANVSTAFKDHPEAHWSSSERGGYDFHHRHPLGHSGGPYPRWQYRAAGLIHLQFISDRRLKAKHRLYTLTERLRWPEKPISQINEMYGFTIHEADTGAVSPAPYADWWGAYQPLLQYLHVDAEPWQIAECRKIIAQNPGIEKGLSTFGLEL